jgi:hypothetical protein
LRRDNHHELKLLAIYKWRREMAFRFRRSMKIAPGVRLNIGKKGGSFTVGGRGASVNFGRKGVHSNMGIPGTGLSYRSKIAGTSSISKLKESPKTAPSAGPGKVEMNIALSLKEDGSVTFKDAEGNFLPEEYVSLTKRQNKDFITHWLEENRDEFNSDINSLINIHLETPPPDTEIKFTPAIFPNEEPTPPSKDFVIPQPIEPNLKEYNFFAKRIEIIRNLVDKKNSNLLKEYKNKLVQWESEKTSFEAILLVKQKQYLEELQQYNVAKTNFNENQEIRKVFIEEERLNNPSAMSIFLEESLQTFEWPRETLISFDIISGGTEVRIDVDLPEIEDMPEQLARVNKRELRLTYKDISETQKRKNYFIHVHSIGFRIIGEVFVSLPSVQSVVLSGYSQRTNQKTGQIVDEYLYSVQVIREKWETINFQNLGAVDIVSCFEEFNLRRKATKTGVITPIDPF